MSLAKYKQKRNFKQTSEPIAGKASGDKPIFVVQRHHATRLHYDFRLEIDGTLKSWAVPKGPSLNPADKRLAMEVEDHPYDYKDFQGQIPAGNYGAGYVYIWDKGTFDLLDEKGNALKEWKSGSLKVVLHGKKLKGEFALVKMKGGRDENAWLMIKHKDKYAVSGEYNSEDYTPKRVIEKKKGEVISGVKKAAVPKKTVATKAAVPKKAASKKSAVKKAAAPKKAVARKAASTNVKKKARPAESAIRKSKIKEWYHPMLATLVDEPFDREGWIFETKWDGYRAIAQVENGKAELYSRNQISFNKAYAPVKTAVEKIPHNVVLDGEVVILGTNNYTDFQALQNYKRTGKGKLTYEVFDLLHLDGHDLTGLSLIERKTLLQELIKQLKDPVIKYSAHITAKGNKLFEKAEQQGWEGIIAKNGESDYEEGARSFNWLKMKILNRQEVIICGYTAPRGSRKKIGALILGVYEKGKLRYVGHCGGGFNDKLLSDLFDLLQPHVQETSPFSEKIKTNTAVTWLKPVLVCEVKFAGWTGDGILRQPIFVALREDKPAKTIKQEKPMASKSIAKAAETGASKVVDSKSATTKKGTTTTKAATSKKSAAKSAKVASSKAASKKAATKSVKVASTKSASEKASATSATPARSSARSSKSSKAENDRTLLLNKQTVVLTNQQKIYWPKEKITKGQLIDYYMEVADYILPHLKDRALSLHRFPNGITGASFYQKDMDVKTIPGWLKTTSVYADSTGKDVDYLVCNDKATLAYMINLGCIEVNPWLSRISKPENPDNIVIDLDPEGIPFSAVVETANCVHDILDKYGISSYCKASGSTGLHIYIPTGAKYEYETCRLFAEFVARETNAQLPDITSVVRAKSARKKKVYVDFLQNGRGQTIAAPYSARPKPGATVSMPLEWKELNAKLDMKDFHIGNAVSRLKKKGDLWAGIYKDKNDLKVVLKKGKQ